MKTDMDNAEIFAVPFYEEDFFRNDKYECNLITKQIYYKKEEWRRAEQRQYRT